MPMFRPLQRYFDFKGRSGRAEYWLFALFQALVFAVLLVAILMTFVMVAVRAAGGGGGADLALTFIGLTLVTLLLALVLVIPHFAVLARRLHDSGLSAWWGLLMAPGMLTQAVSPALARAAVRRMATGQPDDLLWGMASTQSGLTAMVFVGFVCNLALFVLLLRPSQPGVNRFGPPPNGETSPKPAPTPADLAAAYRAEVREAMRPATAARSAQPPPAQPHPVEDWSIEDEPQPAPFPAQANWGRPAWDPGVTPGRPFGRRAH